MGRWFESIRAHQVLDLDTGNSGYVLGNSFISAGVFLLVLARKIRVEIGAANTNPIEK
jgi:hypothetical protein